MKQILQSLKTGAIEVAEIPVPDVSRGQLLIATSHTLVSAGTERMLVQFGKAGLIEKARQQPDKVRLMVDKIRTDGFVATIDAVRSKLDQALVLGYCNVGRVISVGSGVDGFKIGDRVASNGVHAEIVAVPKNLCAHIPDNVSDEAAVFTVLAAIGLQGIRLANPTLGECVVVTGLGLIGLMTVQILRAQGCRVLGIDFEPVRLDLARKFGAQVVNPSAGEDLLVAAQALSRGRGVDAVIITASTNSNEPVSQAAHMCRKRGRIVLVGVTGLDLTRADFYEKELTFQVSCSYGPGRYDPAYEKGGQDYPIGFVRWTEQRNFEAVLDLMASRQLDVKPLISHRFEIARAEDAYQLLTSKTPSLGILLQYPTAVQQPATAELQRKVVLQPQTVAEEECVVAFLGAGNYAGRVLIPAFKKAGARLYAVVSAGGVSAVHFGKKYGFEEAGTDIEEVMANSGIDTVVIATRHDAHARQVLAALQAGKHVFCEKPLCLTLHELKEIEAMVASRPSQLLTVGFNRRFAPQMVHMKSLCDTVAEPKSFVMTVNAGAIPPGHWTQDPLVGGGRIIGEACHFVDLLRFLAGVKIIGCHSIYLGNDPLQDNAMLNLSFADGSVGTIHYLARGHKSFPKEQLEIFCAGRVLKLDNFRMLKGYGWPGFKKMNLWRQDKGQAACTAAFVRAVQNGGPSPIPFEEIIEVSRVTLELSQGSRTEARGLSN